MSPKRHVGVQDPAVGDQLAIDDEVYDVIDRCPCERKAQHIRWFLAGQSKLGGVTIPQEASLSKEWDSKNEEWWWFGRRVSATELRAGKERLSDRVRREAKEPPKRLFYEGRLYKLAGQSDPPADEGEDAATIWEYVDSRQIDSILLELTSDGLTAYHGAYYNPKDIRIR